MVSSSYSGTMKRDGRRLRMSLVLGLVAKSCALLLPHSFWLQRREGNHAVGAHLFRNVRPLPLSAIVTSTDQDDASATSLESSSSTQQSLAHRVLQTMQSSTWSLGQSYAEQMDLGSAEAALYAFFVALRQVPVPLGLHSQPLVLRYADLQHALQHSSINWSGFFTMQDLQHAVQEDFLDAARGSTNKSKGWKITDVSQPRGESFEDARMTFDDVQAALRKGTVIFNAAGAHIPKLAGPCLAACHATTLPCAMNLYITAAQQQTSAPPHTDRQDVVIVQSTGRKRWKVFRPPNPAANPDADIFARGKGHDRLPLHALEAGEWGTELLLETILHPGDLLFVPAAFPHTTSTVVNDDVVDVSHASSYEPGDDDTSIHMTFNIDHHIWDLDYLSARRLALQRAGVRDTALPPSSAADAVDDYSRYRGKVNELPSTVHRDLFTAFPLGFLDKAKDGNNENIVDRVVTELVRVSREVDDGTASEIPETIWKDTVLQLRQQGQELLETHVDMYVAALEEGRLRQAEAVMTAHVKNLSSDQDDVTSSMRRVMTPERMKRLSLFRVKRYYDQINTSKRALKEWGLQGIARVPSSLTTSSVATSSGAHTLPVNWAFTFPVKVGDQVEADLGGAFFSAKVTRISASGMYDVQFFDGDREIGLDRCAIKLISPPASPNVGDEKAYVDTSSMTPKELKRWKKQQEKQNRK